MSGKRQGEDTGEDEENTLSGDRLHSGEDLTGNCENYNRFKSDDGACVAVSKEEEKAFETIEVLKKHTHTWGCTVWEEICALRQTALSILMTLYFVCMNNANESCD